MLTKLVGLSPETGILSLPSLGQKLQATRGLATKLCLPKQVITPTQTPYREQTSDRQGTACPRDLGQPFTRNKNLLNSPWACVAATLKWQWPEMWGWLSLNPRGCALHLTFLGLHIN